MKFPLIMPNLTQFKELQKNWTQFMGYSIVMFFLVISFLPVIVNPCEKWVSLGLIIVVNFAMGLILTTACKTIPNEMGGEFAGQIYAVTNTISNMAGFFGILLVFLYVNC